jgi:hypothetical protein
MAYSVQAIDSIGAPVRIKLRTRISLKFHCNRRPLESCRRQTTNQNGPRRSGASDCSRWACVRDVARGRRPQISHAAHRVGAPTDCSGIRSRDRARGTSFAGASAPRWPLLRASWSRAATGRILIADYSIQSRRISVVRPIFWPSQQELSRYLKYRARARIPEFESDMPSRAVGLSQVRSPAIVMHRVGCRSRRSGRTLRSLTLTTVQTPPMTTTSFAV